MLRQRGKIQSTAPIATRPSTFGCCSEACDKRGFHVGLDFLGSRCRQPSIARANEADGLDDIGEGGDAIREAVESTRQPIGIYDRSLGVDEHAHRSVFSQLGQNLFTIIVQQFGAQE